MRKWAAVVSWKCDHGNVVPMQGIARGGTPWYGLFCPAGQCRPSWRSPSDPWVISRAPVSDEEARERMASVRACGVLPLVSGLPVRTRVAETV